MDIICNKAWDVLVCLHVGTTNIIFPLPLEGHLPPLKHQVACFIFLCVQTDTKASRASHTIERLIFMRVKPHAEPHITQCQFNWDVPNVVLLKQKGHDQFLHLLPAAGSLGVEIRVWKSSWLYFTCENSSYSDVKPSTILWQQMMFSLCHAQTA